MCANNLTAGHDLKLQQQRATNNNYNCKSMWKMLLALVALLFGLAGTDSAQILGLFAHPGKSHFDFFRPIFTGLAERGHNISMYSYFPLKQPMVNYTDYVFEGMPVLTDVVDLKVRGLSL